MILRYLSEVQYDRSIDSETSKPISLPEVRKGEERCDLKVGRIHDSKIVQDRPFSGSWGEGEKANHCFSIKYPGRDIFVFSEGFLFLFPCSCLTFFGEARIWNKYNYDVNISCYVTRDMIVRSEKLSLSEGLNSYQRSVFLNLAGSYLWICAVVDTFVMGNISCATTVG